MRRIPRRLARAPIGVFRRGLGRIFAGRLVMVEHRGRRSGQPRQVVLEVLLREDEALVVPSGYGRSAQWFQNVAADPRVRLWWRRTAGAPGQAEILSAAESVRLLEKYRTEHRLRSRAVGRMLGLPELARAAPLPPDVGTRVPLVRLSSPLL